jgi:hypothetical protein
LPNEMRASPIEIIEQEIYLRSDRVNVLQSVTL